MAEQSNNLDATGRDDIGDQYDSREDALNQRIFDPAGDTDDTVTEEDLDRLQVITGGADDEESIGADLDPELEREFAKLDASTEEEVDALRVNLMQDAEFRDSRDGTGPIVDDIAQERMAGMTEVGEDVGNRGVVSLTPGREDTSDVIRQHHPNSELARSQNVVEGNMDETRDEARTDRTVDEGTAA